MSAVIAVEEYPSYSEEVQRKAYDTLAMLAARRENKTIGDGEFLACMDALAYAYGGLLDTDFMRLVDGFRDTVKTSSEASRSYAFYRTADKSFVVLLKNLKIGILKVMGRDATGELKVTVKRFDKEDDPIMATEAHFGKMKANLVNIGFDEFV